jgi:hypothetical protein
MSDQEKRIQELVGKATEADQVRILHGRMDMLISSLRSNVFLSVLLNWPGSLETLGIYGGFDGLE